MVLGKTYLNGIINDLYLGSTLIYSKSSLTPNAMVITVDSRIIGETANNKFYLPTSSFARTFLYDIHVIEDGQYISGLTEDYTIIFTTPGIYNIEIIGTTTGFVQMYFANSHDKNKLLDIRQWGHFGWVSLNNAFNGCSNLGTISATDAPDLTSNFDTTWYDAQLAFMNTPNFNGDIGHWNLGYARHWANTFNGSGLDTNLAAWDISNITSLTNFLVNGGMSTSNYDDTLIGWAAQTPNTGLECHFGSSVNTLGGAAEAAKNVLINTYLWTITDGHS